MTMVRTLTKGSLTVDLMASPYEFMEEPDFGGITRSAAVYGGPGFDLPGFGATDTSTPRSVPFEIIVKGTSADTCATYVADLLAVLPDDDTPTTYTIGANGSAYTGTLIARRVDGLVSKPYGLYEYHQYRAKVTFTLVCDPYVYGAAQVPIGNSLADAPLGSAWPVDWTSATYPSGKGIISLRFDDGTSEDYSYTMQELADRDLTAGFAIVTDLIGVGGYMTSAQIAKIESYGNEIMCHSYTHGSDPTTFTEFKYETKGALDALTALGFNVRTFVQPGSWTGIYYIDDATWVMGCAADLYLREHFAAYEGYYQVNKRTLPVTATTRYGASHKSPDAYTGGTYNTKTYIDDAIASACGYEMLFHSVTIGASGISKADFEATLDYLVTKQTAGDLVVLTPTQQLYAVPA